MVQRCTALPRLRHVHLGVGMIRAEPSAQLAGVSEPATCRKTLWVYAALLDHLWSCSPGVGSKSEEEVTHSCKIGNAVPAENFLKS